MPEEIKVGEYTIKPYPPTLVTWVLEQKNVVWIERENGEGMTVDLDKLWEREF